MMLYLNNLLILIRYLFILQKNDEIEQSKRALYDEWIKYIEEWHPVNSMTNANPSKSIELDKKIGLANHIIRKPYSKISRFSNERKSDRPTTHTKPKSSIPKFSDNRNTSKPAFPLKRKITQLNQPIRKNTQRHRFPNRRQTTALASNSLFRVINDFYSSIFNCTANY